MNSDPFLSPDENQSFNPGTLHEPSPHPSRDHQLSEPRSNPEELDWEVAEACYHNGELIELKIIDQNRGGLIAALGNLRGFIPNSHIPALHSQASSRSAMEIKRRQIGTTLSLLVIEANRTNNKLILSARIGHQSQPEVDLHQFKIGDIVTGRVVNLAKFGAFVDLGNRINGLVHISELSWKRINHPSEIVKVGDELTVQILFVDRERQRINLSRKVLQPNPWETVEKRYKVGDLVEGVVTSIRSFGIFFKLAAGVEGLLHQSEFPTGTAMVSIDTLQPGDKLLVRITSIQPDTQRIRLSLQQVSIEEQIAWLTHIAH